jgi:inner membrane protein
MDSLTHIVLGAATGEVMLGRKVGNKAMIWGAIAGSLPDFDAFITPFLNPVSSVLFHRGPSHSILFAIIVAPLIGFIINKLHKTNSFKQWTLMIFVSILMHSTIDCFNTYGTALLWPFSNARLAFDSIGIIDLILLLPIIVLLIVALLKPKFSKIRRTISLTVLIYTLVFVAFSVGNKIIIENKVKAQLDKMDLNYSRLKTAPLPLTNFLWLAIAEDSLGYHYGYISNFDKEPIDFKYVYRNSEILGEYSNSNEVKDLIRFTDGFYTVEQKTDKNISVHDLRFGSMAFEDEEKWYVFTFDVTGDYNSPTISRAHPNRSFSKENISAYWRRIFRDID